MHSGTSNIPTLPGSATWLQNRDHESRAPEDPRPAAHVRRAPKVGARTELARYSVPAGERVLYGQRVDGIVRVTDRPAGDSGRAYLVERELETKGELRALVADYLLCGHPHKRYYADPLVMPTMG